MKRIIPLIFIIMPLSILVGCSFSQYQPSSIVTPGRIDEINKQVGLPGIEDWRYDNDRILVYRVGSGEVNANAAMFFWYWKTDTLQKINIPNLIPDHALSAVQNPKSEFIIGYAKDKKIHIFNTETQKDVLITDGTDLDFSPDGLKIALWREGQLIIKDLETQEERVVHTWKPNDEKDRIYISGLRWSPDGKYLIFIKITNHPDITIIDDTVIFIDLSSGSEVTLDHGSFLGAVTWSPDSRLVTYVRKPVTENAELVITNPNLNCIVSNIKIPNQDGTAYWSPDGKVILIEYFGKYYFVNVERVFGRLYDKLSCNNRN